MNAVFESGYIEPPNAIVAESRSTRVLEVIDGYGPKQGRLTGDARKVHLTLQGYYERLWLTVRSGGAPVAKMHVIARLMKFGPQGAAQFGPSEPIGDGDPRDKDIEDALEYLQGEYNIRYKAIVALYAEFPAPSMEAVGRKLGVGVSRARNLLSEGRQHLATFLIGRWGRLNPDL